MYIKVTTRGDRYARKLLSESIDDADDSGTDLAILSIIAASGEFDLEEFLEDVENHPVPKSSIRRLFEVGYIEEV